MVRTLGKLLKLPVAISDATAITQAGYVGDDVESVLTRLLNAANNDMQLAQKGIVYIDEIDKIAKVANDRGRDVAGEGVQQGLLKILEGSMVALNPDGPKKQANSPTVWMDTTDILFIGGGAFSGIEVLKNSKSVGIGSEHGAKADYEIKSKDLIAIGMIPEFVGRLPVIAQLEELSTKDLVKVLRDTKNSLTQQYAALMKMDGIDATFTEEFLNGLAEEAKKEGTGARGLRALMERCLEDRLYDGPESKLSEITIDESFLETLKGKKK
jgi:ATP-dependent Clp protease ATP-binding subunit ClpX